MRNLYILGTPISGLFRQGKFHYYLLFTAIIEFERTYLISNLVHQHKMKKRVADELKLDKKLADI